MASPRSQALAMVATIALAGCVKKSTHAKTLAELADARARIAAQDKQIKQLDGDLTHARGEVDTLSSGKTLTEEELSKVRGEKESTEADLAELREKRAADQKRLAAFQELQDWFKSLVDSGALEVVFRNGQMTLKLPSGVLFPSGSAELSEDGKKTLAKVTKVLMAFKDRRFLVAGHTDNLPINTDQFANNWYLSTARAVSVVEFMGMEGFPPEKLAAAGYADKDPVGNNKSKKGRMKNRRIEIILVPDLSELPKLARDAK